MRLKDCYNIDECIKRLGEKFNRDQTYKVFASHITLVPSISSTHPNMEKDDIVKIVEKSINEVKQELGNGR